MRILKFCLTFLIIFTSLRHNAQGANFVWAQQFGGNLNDNCWSVCDQPGNVYRMMGGIAKHNSAGVQQWTISAAYFPLSISFDATGDLYVLGYFSTTIDLNSGAGTYTVAPVGGFDLAVVKLSGSTGNFIWGGSIGGPGNEYDGVITTDPSGNVFIAATFTGVCDVNPAPGTLNLTATATDFFVNKLDPAGTLVWTKQFSGNSGSYIGALDLDPSGNIYFCGGFSGTVDFDPGAGVSNLVSGGTSDYDMFIGKLDGSGNFLWVKQMGATGPDLLRDLEVGTNGNLYCSGSFSGAVDFDGGPGTLTANSGTATSSFIAEFNGTGTPSWVRNLSGYFITAMAVDQNNAFCMTGQFGSADFDPGAGTYTMSANGGTWPDIYISKINSAGNFIWAKQIGSINEDGPTTLSVDGSNNIHLAGRFKTLCDFNPNGGYYPLTAVGGNFNYDGFMLKLCQAPDPSILVGSPGLCEGQSETYSVVPVTDAQYYTWTLPGGWTGLSTTNSILATAGSTGGNVIFQAGNSCGLSPASTLQVVVSNCQAIKKHDLSSQSLYPNPSGGEVYLETSDNYAITVFNGLGEIVHKCTVTAGKNALDLEGLVKGIYFVQLDNNKERSLLKLVVQ